MADKQDPLASRPAEPPNPKGDEADTSSSEVGNEEPGADFIGVDIWERIDPTLVVVIPPQVDGNEDDGAVGPPNGAEDSPKASLFTKPNKRNIWAWTLVAIVVWLYVVLKVFVFDVDRWLANRILGDDSIVDYRLLMILAAVAFVVLVIRRSWLPLAYVFLFPLVVTCIYTPWVIYKTRSWRMLFAAVHILSSATYRFRWRFLAATVTAFSAVGILVTGNAAVVSLGGIWILGFLSVLYYRAFIASLTPSRFIGQQLESIQWLVRSKLTWTVVGLEDELKAPEIVRYNATQIQTITNKIGFGLTLHRAVYVWAKNLQRYGSSGTSATIAFSYFVWLYFASFVLLGFANMALYNVDPSQFKVATSPSIVEWAFYSLSALALNGTEGIVPTGDIAFAIRIYAGVVGPLLLLTLLAGLLLDRRNARQVEDLNSAVEDLKHQGSLVSDRFREDYGVSPREAAARLERLGLTIGLSWFASALPDNYDESE